MRDINGREIKVGDTVKTQQPGGGILPPAPPQIGEVVEGTDAFGGPTLLIRYKKPAPNDWWRYIDLKHKINEVQLNTYLIELYALAQPGKIVYSYTLNCATHSEASEEARDILPKRAGFKITLVR